MASGGPRGYLTVLGHRGATLPFLCSILARLPYALVPLSTVLLVQHVRGSYGDAGLVTGAYGIGTALGAPLLGRALDRIGHLRVLAPSSVACGALLGGLAAAAAADAPLVVLVTLGWLAGLVFPPMGPAMRTAWRTALPEGPLRAAGYALDAVAVETIFIGGPVLLSVMVTRTPPPFPLAITAALLVVGCLTFVATPASRAVVLHPAHDNPDVAGPRTALVVPGMRPLLVVAFCMAIGFGSIDTSLAATARTVLNDPAMLGVLFACIAGGSTSGGLVYGAVTHRLRGAEHRRIAYTLAGFSVGLLPMPFLLNMSPPPMAAVLPLLFVAGVCIAPTIIMQLNLIDALCPPHRTNEGQAWQTTAVTTGAAIGTGAAGVLIDHVGVPGSFGQAVGATAVGAVLAVLARRSWERRSTLTRVSPDVVAAATR